MARKLDFTIHGREAWVHPGQEGFHQNHWFVLDGEDYHTSDGLLTSGRWTVNGYADIFDNDPEEEVRQFADQPPVATPTSRYHSWKLPFQIEGEDVYINDDRMEHPNTNDCSSPFYLANGPVGHWDKRLNHGRPEWVPANYGSWWSYNTLELILSASVLQPYHPSVSTLIPVDLNSMTTMTAASPYESYRLPFDINGQPAYLNNDAGMGVYAGQGNSYSWYIGNGPAQAATACLGAGPTYRWMTRDGRPEWCTIPTTYDSLERACGAASEPLITYEEIKTMPAAPVAPPTPITPEEKRKLLERAAGSTLWGLMNMDPLPPLTKGLVLANLKVYVPEEVTDVVGHLLEHWTPPVATPHRQYRRTSATTTTAPAQPYSINLSGGERVSGRASYTAYRTYSTTQRFTAAELADIIDGSTDRDEAVNKLREAMEEELREHDNGCEDYEYEDEEETDSDGLEMDVADFAGLLERLYADHPEYDPEWGEEDEQEDEEVPAGDADPLQLGVYVEVNGHEDDIRFVGAIGRVVETREITRVGVEFDHPIHTNDGVLCGHSCGGQGEAGYCWNVRRDICRVIPNPASV